MNAIIIRTTVATLVAYLGGGVGYVIGGSAKGWIDYLINAALGALLAVTLLDILPDAAHMLPLWQFAAATLGGWGLFWLIGKYAYPVCPACAMHDEGHSKTILGRTLVLMILALSVHSTLDGAAVVIGDEIVKGVNLPVFFAVSFHKFPEGIAVILLMIGSGYPRTTALWWTLAIEGTTELGGLAAVLFIHSLSPAWMGLIFGCIGGGFLYLVVTAFSLVTRPTAAAPARSTKIAGAVAFAFTGLLILVSQHFG